MFLILATVVGMEFFMGIYDQKCYSPFGIDLTSCPNNTIEVTPSYTASRGIFSTLCSPLPTSNTTTAISLFQPSSEYLLYSPWDQPYPCSTRGKGPCKFLGCGASCPLGYECRHDLAQYSSGLLSFDTFGHALVTTLKISSHDHWAVYPSHTPIIGAHVDRHPM